jgi:Flp pilus assembly protein TadD
MDTLGYVMVEQGDVAKGLAMLRKAATLAPNNPDIHFHVAWALHKSGDGAGARKELEQLLAKGTKFSLEEDAKTLLKQL